MTSTLIKRQILNIDTCTQGALDVKMKKEIGVMCQQAKEYQPVVCQSPLSMGFPRQEYWSGLPFPSPGDLPEPGIEPTYPVLQADCLLLSHQGKG